VPPQVIYTSRNISNTRSSDKLIDDKTVQQLLKFMSFRSKQLHLIIWNTRTWWIKIIKVKILQKKCEKLDTYTIDTIEKTKTS